MLKLTKAYMDNANWYNEVYIASIQSFAGSVSGTVVVKKMVFAPIFRPKPISLRLFPTIIDFEKSITGKSF